MRSIDPTMSEKTWLRIADLWFNQNYRPVYIAEELQLSMDEVEKAIRILGKIEKIIKQR